MYTRIFDYKCRECSFEFEKFVRFENFYEVECEDCPKCKGVADKVIKASILNVSWDGNFPIEPGRKAVNRKEFIADPVKLWGKDFKAPGK